MITRETRDLIQE